MNNLKKVYKHLNKEELSIQKIELALVDDIEKTYNKIKSDADALSGAIRRAANEVDDIANKSKAIVKRIDATDSDVKKLVSSAKDLGIELPPEAKISIRQLQAYRSDLSELQSRADKSANGLYAMLG